MRGIAIFTTLCGVGVVALLIGLVSSTIGDKIEDLRKGKSPVIDENHTLILGYGEKVFAILRELREANSNQAHASVVILSETEKEEVETAVKERMGDMGPTRVVVRQGSPYSVHDLRKVGAGRAKSIIILSESDDDGEDADAAADMGAIKTLLALRRIPGRAGERTTRWSSWPTAPASRWSSSWAAAASRWWPWPRPSRA